MRLARHLLVPAACLPLLASPRAAWAHAFGVRYDLPLPFGYYLVAAAAALVLSFVVMVLVGKRGERTAESGLALLRIDERGYVLRVLKAGLAFLGCAVFFLLLFAGIAGSDSPQRNIAPLTVWVLWWVGFALFTAFVGNLWPLLDPWRALARLSSSALASGQPRVDGLPSSWIAPFLFLLFVGLELIGSSGENPMRLAFAICGFSLITWIGMARFGIEGWGRHADPFQRVFSLLGRFAPLGLRKGPDGAVLVLRFPGAGLLGDEPKRAGDVAFVMLLLASVSFDGFSETPLWAKFLDWAAASELLRPALLWLRDQGVDLLAFLRACGLLAAPILISAVYLFFCKLMVLAGGSGRFRDAAHVFALSLLPIAIAYHLAHYFSYLLFAGQLAIPMLSDPFGWGWDLFGTADYVIDISVIGAKGVWYLSVAAVVTGHLVSVVLGHLEALRFFPSHRAAMLSQIPMLALMVLFTLGSLWILAQPVVAGAG